MLALPRQSLTGSADLSLVRYLTTVGDDALISDTIADNLGPAGRAFAHVRTLARTHARACLPAASLREVRLLMPAASPAANTARLASSRLAFPYLVSPCSELPSFRFALQ